MLSVCPQPGSAGEAPGKPPCQSLRAFFASFRPTPDSTSTSSPLGSAHAQKTHRNGEIEVINEERKCYLDAFFSGYYEVIIRTNVMHDEELSKSQIYGIF